MQALDDLQEQFKTIAQGSREVIASANQGRWIATTAVRYCSGERQGRWIATTAVRYCSGERDKTRSFSE